MPRRRFPEYRTRDELNAWEDGYEAGKEYMRGVLEYGRTGMAEYPRTRRRRSRARAAPRRKPRKAVKLSTWQRYIKNKKNHIKLRSGKLNLKKMAVQYRKKHKK